MSAVATQKITKEALDALYARYNRLECVHPDPVEFVHLYGDPLDREIVGFVAASLAYGRVAQILGSVARVLERMGPPAAFLRGASRESLGRTFADFRHRFAAGEELAALLFGLKQLIERHGSLNASFVAFLKAGDETIAPALAPFMAELTAAAGGLDSHLLPRPSRGSACKRLNLFLRWMVRHDDVDPGGWTGASPAMLIVPLDVHMHRICRALGLTGRSQADLRAALEVTAAFREFDPDDPVRYDFAITRLGIWRETDRGEFLKQYGVEAS